MTFLLRRYEREHEPNLLGLQNVINKYPPDIYPLTEKHQPRPFYDKTFWADTFCERR
jgi:hypothetical protein